MLQRSSIGPETSDLQNWKLALSVPQCCMYEDSTGRAHFHKHSASQKRLPSGQAGDRTPDLAGLAKGFESSIVSPPCTLSTSWNSSLQ